MRNYPSFKITGKTQAGIEFLAQYKFMSEYLENLVRIFDL